MTLLADLAKAKGVNLGEYLRPQEVDALETALRDPKKHAAARVLVSNLEKKMDAGKKKALESLLKDQFHW